MPRAQQFTSGVVRAGIVAEICLASSANQGKTKGQQLKGKIVS